MTFSYNDSTLYTFDTRTQEEHTAIMYYKFYETFKDADPEAKEYNDNSRVK